MKKSKRNEKPISDYDFQDFGLDKNFKKQTHLNNVQDLITYKEKQMNNKKHQLGIKNTRNDDESEMSSDFLFEEEVQAQQNGSRYAEKQAADQSKEQLLETINRMMAKNKINNKTAFDVPILSVEDFAMYDESHSGDVAWSKMSCILENDYKIYGVRVDAIAQFVKKMSDSLGRKNTQTKDGPQKQNVVSNENNNQANQRAAKYTQLMSTEVKNNLVLHLQKNSENININLRTKLMMRKDPLFERTSRRFDHTSYNSLFMNTLTLTEGLQMQINATQDHVQHKNGQNRKVDVQYGQVVQKQMNNGNKNQIVEPISQYKHIIQSAIQNHDRRQMKINESIFTFRLRFIDLGVEKSFDENSLRQQNKDYAKIINMILQGHMKSGFELGTQLVYSESQKQLVQQGKQQETPSHNKIQNDFVNLSNAAIEINTQQNNKVLDNYQDMNIKIIKNQKTEKKFKIIKQVISIKQLTDDPDLIKTRRKKINTDIKNIIETERKSLPPLKKVEREMFDPTVKADYNRVLKKQKYKEKYKNVFQNIKQTNLILPVLRTFNKQYVTFLRPVATMEEINKENEKANLHSHEHMSVTLYPCRQYKPEDRESRAQEQSSEEWEIRQLGINQRSKKNQTITVVKQNIYSIVKLNRAMDVNWLKEEYEKAHGQVSSSTIFIAMLHLANQRFIKCVQQTRKNFKISIYDFD